MTARTPPTLETVRSDVLRAYYRAELRGEPTADAMRAMTFDEAWAVLRIKSPQIQPFTVADKLPWLRHSAKDWPAPPRIHHAWRTTAFRRMKELDLAGAVVGDDCEQLIFERIARLRGLERLAVLGSLSRVSMERTACAAEAPRRAKATELADLILLDCEPETMNILSAIVSARAVSIVSELGPVTLEDLALPKETIAFEATSSFGVVGLSSLKGDRLRDLRVRVLREDEPVDALFRGLSRQLETMHLEAERPLDLEAIVAWPKLRRLHVSVALEQRDPALELALAHRHIELSFAPLAAAKRLAAAASKRRTGEVLYKGVPIRKGEAERGTIYVVEADIADAEGFDGDNGALEDLVRTELGAVDVEWGSESGTFVFRAPTLASAKKVVHTVLEIARRQGDRRRGRRRR